MSNNTPEPYGAEWEQRMKLLTLSGIIELLRQARAAIERLEKALDVEREKVKRLEQTAKISDGLLDHYCDAFTNQEEEPDEVDSFDTCPHCTQPDACSDFVTCSIKAGLVRPAPGVDGVF